MKTDQQFTPKYWVAHDPREDDVYMETSSKSYDECYQQIKALMFSEEALVTAMENEEIKISLMEIKFVKE